MPNFVGYNTLVYFFIYVLLAIFSFIFAGHRLMQAGINSEVRSLILKRHVIYIVYFFIANLQLVVLCYTVVNPNVVISPHDSWPFVVLKVLMATQGYVMPLLRLSEPYFYWSVRNSIVNWWTRFRKAENFEEIEQAGFDRLYIERMNEFYEEARKKSRNDVSSICLNESTFTEKSEKDKRPQKDNEMAPLFLFLASSFNVELVYIMLKSITQFCFFNSENKENELRMSD